MKANVFLVASVSLFALSGCATYTVSPAGAADRAAIDYVMPASALSAQGAMPPLKANPTPVRVEK